MISYPEYSPISLDSIDRVKDDMRRWRNDPGIYSTCRQVGLINEIQQENWYKSQAVDPKIRMYSIVLKENPPSDCAGALAGWMEISIGVCGLTSIDHTNQTAEYSLYIAPEYQKKGYATPALKTLVRHGFDDLNLFCIWGEIFDFNGPSLHIAEKIGFKKEGVLHSRYYKQGRRINTIVVSLLRDEWRKNG